MFAGSRGGHAFNPRGLVSLKGLDHPTAVPGAVGARPASRRLRASAAAAAPGRALVGVRRPGRGARPPARSDEGGGGRDRAGRAVRGEPGIGKTALPRGVGAAAHEQGATVLYGRCDEDLASRTSRGPRRSASWCVHAPGRAARVQVGARGSTGLVPELRQRRPDLAGAPGAIPTPTGTSSTRRSSTCSRRLSTERRSSSSSTTCTGRTSARCSSSGTWPRSRPACGCSSSGRSETPKRHVAPLADIAGRVPPEHGVERMALRGLSDEELLEFMERVAGQEMDATGIGLRDALFAETDGQPVLRRRGAAPPRRDRCDRSGAQRAVGGLGLAGRPRPAGQHPGGDRPPGEPPRHRWCAPPRRRRRHGARVRPGRCRAARRSPRDLGTRCAGARGDRGAAR